jgi:hypothetical protein
MDKKTTMTLAEAASFQPSFDAVAAGVATAAQLSEVEAVQIAVVHYMRDIGALADAQVRGRKALLDGIPEARQAKVLIALDGKAAAPAVWWDNEAKTLVTEATAAEVEAYKNPPAPEPDPQPIAEPAPQPEAAEGE